MAILIYVRRPTVLNNAILLLGSYTRQYAIFSCKPSSYYFICNGSKDRLEISFLIKFFKLRAGLVFRLEKENRVG